jgi:uncharacterized protein YkwD
MGWYILITFLAIVIPFIFIRCSKPETPIEVDNTYLFESSLLTIEERKLLTYITNYRNQVAPADRSATLLARKHCDYMIENGLASHDNFPDRRRILLNKGAKSVAEIISFGQGTPEKALNAFVKSADHKKALDNKRYNICGICVKSDTDGRKYYVVLLIEI